MNTLVVSTDGKLRVTRPLWRAAEKHFDFSHVEVKGERGLVEYFETASFQGIDRVIADTNLRRLGKHYVVLKNAPGLVVFDHDVCQNNVRASEWHKRYPAVLRDLGEVRIMVSGAVLAKQLEEEGVDAVFLPKAYDSEVIFNKNLDRKTRAAFVGRIKNKVYVERKKFLQSLQKRGVLEILRAEPGEPYNNLLNNIRVFVSADIGFGEYMIKNFEAMAAGCVLVAWRQPSLEQEALGLVDGENVVLYESAQELDEKLRQLDENPEMAREIAEAGERLARERHTWSHRASEIFPLIEPPIRHASPLKFRDRLKLLGVRL